MVHVIAFFFPRLNQNAVHIMLNYIFSRITPTYIESSRKYAFDIIDARGNKMTTYNMSVKTIVAIMGIFMSKRKEFQDIPLDMQKEIAKLCKGLQSVPISSPSPTPTPTPTQSPTLKFNMSSANAFGLTSAIQNWRTHGHDVGSKEMDAVDGLLSFK